MATGAGIPIRWAVGSDDIRGALALRERVFCDEQGVPRDEEIDERDEQALHLVALDPDSKRVIGTLRLLVEEEPARVGRVAVEREWRRRGIAARMLVTALTRARARGCSSVRLAAQVEAVELYEKAGFAVESKPFEEAGIPHVWMSVRLPR
jgi:putative N-acetyltransferase (TIGR04045 family)